MDEFAELIRREFEEIASQKKKKNWRIWNWDYRMRNFK